MMRALLRGVRSRSSAVAPSPGMEDRLIDWRVGELLVQPAGNRRNCGAIGRNVEGKRVIIRVFRSRVKPGMHEEYERLLRDTAIPLMLAAPGLVKLHVGTPLDDPPQEFLLMSVWEDIGSLRAFFGRKWRESVVVPGEAHLVAEAIVDHYEVLEYSALAAPPPTASLVSLAE